MQQVFDSLKNFGFHSLLTNYKTHRNFASDSHPTIEGAKQLLGSISNDVIRSLEFLSNFEVKEIKKENGKYREKIVDYGSEPLSSKEIMKMHKRAKPGGRYSHRKRNTVILIAVACVIVFGFILLKTGLVQNLIDTAMIYPTLSPQVSKIINDIADSTINLIPYNSQESPPIPQTTSYYNSIWPCSLKSDSSGKIDVNCHTNELYHFNNPSIGNLEIEKVRLAWNSESNYRAFDQNSLEERVYNLGNLVSREIFDAPEPPNTNPKTTIPKVIVPTNSNDQSTTRQANLQDLYSFALNLVNDDRKTKGLNPVVLSMINSAQDHADDQLSVKYFSHWNSDGVKPYVVYTKLGGRGSVAENVYYSYSYCPASNCIENTYDPYEEIKKGEYEMMNNDAASNWGHRDNILDPNHTHVNFGIAYDHERFYFAEHFEDNLVDWQTVKLVGSELTMVGTLPEGYSIYHMDIFLDPEPKALSEYDLDNLTPYNDGYYDQGNLVGMILSEPTGNSYYPECLPGKTIVTSSDGTSECLDYTTFVNNSANPNSINVVVDVSRWTSSDGLHTVYLNLKDSNENLVPSTSLTLEYLK